MIVTDTLWFFWTVSADQRFIKWIATGSIVLLLHSLMVVERAGKLRTLISFVIQEIFVFFICRHLPPEYPVNVIFLWISVFIYEKIIGDKLEIRHNFSFTSDLPSQYYEHVEFIQTSSDTGTLRTDLKCLIVLKRGYSLPKGSLPLDLISSVNAEVIDNKLVRNLHKMGFDVNCCFQVTTDDEKKRCIEFVLVASCPELKNKWVNVLKSWVGILDEEVQKIWLKKLLSVGEEEAVEWEFGIDDALALISKTGRHFNPAYLLHTFESVVQMNQKSTLLRQGLGSIRTKWLKGDKIESKVRLKWDKFSEFFKIMVIPTAMEAVLQRIPGRRKKVNNLSAKMFLHFLQEVQRDIEQAQHYLVKISCIEPVLQYSNVSVIGLSNYLLEGDQLIFNSHLMDCMDQPLSHYYIASSHNTYLTKDQLKSKSSVDMYVKALQRGCKCLELDCWDGSDNEPVIYHGYTLTSKILFKDVITAIKEHAFCRSLYPVILSFEIHCSIDQQKVMAKHLREILGDALYLRPIPPSEFSLPSPNDLKGYIIIKAKKIADGLDEGIVEDLDADLSDDDIELTELNILKELGDQKDTDASDLMSISSHSDDEEMNGHDRKKHKLQALLSDVNLNLNQKPKTKKVLKIAKEMSDLVVYCQAKRFKNFNSSKIEDDYFEMCSFQEKKALKLTRETNRNFTEFNMKQLSRIYPSGYRIDSSNYNPVQFWNVGCQMVALNYQTACREMQLNQGLFRLNGECGYVLKPEFLRNDSNSFELHVTPKQYKTVSIRVIGGHQLPYKYSHSVKSERGYQVQIRTFGVEADNQMQQTTAVKNNGLNPLWDEVFLFKVHVPELAIILFTVCSKAFIAQYSLPLRSLKRGCRIVPLLNKHSELIKESFLLVHVEHS